MTICFNKKLYKLSAIKKAINRFKHLATFNIKQRNNNAFVDIINIDSEVNNILLDEFCNYVLYLMKI